MQRHFEVDLKNLRQQILVMGAHVESAIEAATQSLLQRNLELIKQVQELEAKINQEHMEVDDSCVQILARQSPLAADLRLVIAALKISTDLERMGDQAVNISHNTRDFVNSAKILEVNTNIPIMAQRVKNMVKKSLDAFVNDDKELAQQILLEDDLVDELKNKVFHELIGTMKTRPDTVEAALDLILIARNLERLGDHATNIAEDVIYAATGDDIRHSQKKSHEPKQQKS